MYKMLCLDLDDTLLMEDLTIPKEVKAKLKELVDKGVLVTLSTGRMYVSTKKYAEEIGLTAPLVCYNGAMIRGAKDLEPRHYFPLPMDKMKEIFEFGEERGWYLQLYNGDDIVVRKHTKETDLDGDLLNANCLEVGDLRYAKVGQSPKVMTAGEPSEMPKRLELLQEKFGNDLYIATSKPYLLEMMDKNVSKAHSLDILAKEYGIKPSEVVACGDSTNDLEMLKWAGMGCAMENALETIKEQCDYVCKAQRSYGVLEVINKFF